MQQVSKFEEAMMDEPTVPAPGGMEVGANTGAVRPAGSSAAAASHLHAGGQSGESSSGAAASVVGLGNPGSVRLEHSHTPIPI